MHDPPLPEWPRAWYMFCTAAELGRAPLGRRAFGRDLVAFRPASGGVAVMLGRCPHRGANLADGEVVGDCLRCPFHHWHFAASGACVRIPATTSIPPFARQTAFPAVERHGGVFFFNGREADFPIPELDPPERASAPAFRLTLDCPWYLVGANGIDVQHFRTTHDRELIGEPRVEHPAPHVHRSVCRFRVAGGGWRDQLTRAFAGPEVEMDVTDWAGTLFFVRASFRRTRTYGLVGILPEDAARTHVYITTSVERSRTLAGRVVVDPVVVRVRRYFIREFLRPDVARSAGIRYDPSRLIEADRLLADYFRWLHLLHPRSIPSPFEGKVGDGPEA
jgi:phenylpropionate dioxygenase-like ring-hydroxylating dioxygenase large terminal subunit